MIVLLITTLLNNQMNKHIYYQSNNDIVPQHHEENDIDGWELQGYYTVIIDMIKNALVFKRLWFIALSGLILLAGQVLAGFGLRSEKSCVLWIASILIGLGVVQRLQVNGLARQDLVLIGKHILK
jgi:hypothetical protein